MGVSPYQAWSPVSSIYIHPQLQEINEKQEKVFFIVLFNYHLHFQCNQNCGLI